jgi:serine/threonine protein kinase
MQVGEIIGAYEIEREIGQGGMATVYRARQLKLDRAVAIKVMHQNLLQDESFRARFSREARIVASLEHPNIVPIYDYDEYEGRPYLVMKCIDGPTLKRRALKTGLSLEETVRTMKLVAAALDYAHGRGILHRDIKPSNILLDDEGRPYITDFGLARITQMGESTISHDMMLGTPFYISPEQARGDKDLTTQTDLYSFGVILYELITGAVPFTADTPYAIVHGHIYSEPQPPSERNPNLNDAVDAVIGRALAKKPQQRYDSAIHLMRDFEAALRSDQPEAAYDDESLVEKVIVTAKDTPPAQGAAPAARQQNPEPPVISAPGKARAERRKKRQEVKDDIKREIEASLDLGQFDWGKLSQRFGTGWDEIKSMIEERVDSELIARELGDEDANDYGYDAPDAVDDREIRKRVARKMKARQEFATHLVIFVFINAMLFGIWGFTSGFRGFPWPFIPMLAWGSGVFAQYMEYRSKHGAGAARREAMIRREIEAERARRSGGRATAGKGQVAVPQRGKGKQRGPFAMVREEIKQEIERELEKEFDKEFGPNRKKQGQQHAKQNSATDAAAIDTTDTVAANAGDEDMRLSNLIESPNSVRLNEDGELSDSFVDEAERGQHKRRS